MSDPAAIARACYQAYADSDRDAIERLIADDFSFTSPLDNALSRETYFERCWPNHEHCEAFEFIHVAPVGERVFIVYEAKSSRGNTFRNCEMLTIRNERIAEAEVYFGWNLPHDAPEGGFIDHDGETT